MSKICQVSDILSKSISISLHQWLNCFKNLKKLPKKLGSDKTWLRYSALHFHSTTIKLLLSVVLVSDVQFQSISEPFGMVTFLNKFLFDTMTLSSLQIVLN